MSETDKVCVAVGLGGPEDLRVYWRSVEKRGWNEAIEAAAEWHDARVEIIQNFDNPHNRVLKRIHVESAAAICKLKKP